MHPTKLLFYGRRLDTPYIFNMKLLKNWELFNEKLIFLHKIKIRNNWEREIIKAIELGTQILVEKLKLNNITLTIQRQPGWAGSSTYHVGYYSKNKNLIKINLRNLEWASLKIIMLVLSHEIRHCVQYQNNVCDDITSSIPPNNMKNSYWNKPIEKDARKYQEIYSEIIFNDKRFNFNITPIGNNILIDDYNLTFKKYKLDKKTCRLWNIKEQDYYTDIKILNINLNTNFKKWSPKSIKLFKELYNKYGVEKLIEMKLIIKIIIQKRELNINDLVC